MKKIVFNLMLLMISMGMSAQLGMRFESFRMLYRDAISQNSLVDKTYRHFLSFLLIVFACKECRNGIKYDDQGKTSKLLRT